MKLVTTIKNFLYQNKGGIGLEDAFNLEMGNEDYAHVEFRARATAINEEIKSTIASIGSYRFVGKGLFLVFVLISVTHVWPIISSIRPAYVAEIQLPLWLMSYSGLAFAVVFDVIMAYLALFVNPVAQKARTTVININALYLLLATINGLYILKYFEGLQDWFRYSSVTVLTYFTAGTLIVTFLITLLKLKDALSTLAAANISLKVRTASITAMLSEASYSQEPKQNEVVRKEAEEEMIKALLGNGVKPYIVAKSLKGTYKKNLDKVNAIAESQKIESTLESTINEIGENLEEVK
jgi:hypothetical protein